jgi:beta-lactamase class A
MTVSTAARQEIMEIIKGLRGHVGLYYKDLGGGQCFAVNENDVFLAASIIKVPMLVAAWAMIERGQVRLTDETVITDGEKAGGCGCFSLLPGDIPVTIEGLLNTMTALSDNTATNKLLSLYTLEAFNRAFEALGLAHTSLARFLFDKEAKKAGLENRFQLKEIMDLLEKIYRRTLLGEEASARIIDTLCRQQINHKLPGKLPRGLKIAHKTGEDDGISHDVGLILTGKPYLLGLAADRADVPQWEEALRQISLIIYQSHEEC